MLDSSLFPADYLRHFCEQVFRSFGVSKDDARQAAEVLATSDLRGIDSHGVARLRKYVEFMNEGLINPKPNIRILRERPATATLDGDNGLGLIVGPRANELAMEKAEKVGSGWVAVCHTNHYGIAGYYPLQALKRDLIGWAMTNTGKWMAPTWGAERMLGTNPIAVAFPGLEEPPVVIDLATTAVSYGKVQIKQREGKPLPDGWITDKDGQPSNNVEDLLAGGALLPLGSNYETGGYKGYCLAAMVDLFTGVLSGANWGPFAPPFAGRGQFELEDEVGKGIGHFFGALDIDGFMEVDAFKKRMDAWIRRFRATKPAVGTPGPWVPGDPEREASLEREKSGIPLLAAVIEDLKVVAKITGVAFEESEGR